MRQIETSLTAGKKIAGDRRAHRDAEQLFGINFSHFR
jgi:hypothetical protein